MGKQFWTCGRKAEHNSERQVRISAGKAGLRLNWHDLLAVALSDLPVRRVVFPACLQEMAYQYRQVGAAGGL